ncbi:hypothetical protein ACS0TY_025943 [Phlomoides rotata]
MKARRPVNPSRRISDSGTFPYSSSFFNSRSRAPTYLSIAIFILGAFVIIGYLFRGGGTLGIQKAWVEADFSCNGEVQRAIPILKSAYGNSLHRVLHVGPETCSVVSALLRDEETEAWGVEPYDVEDADERCKRMVHRGIVRVADIRFPLPYRAKSFSLVLVSDALEYLSPKYLNRTIPELARVSSDGLVIFTGYPHHRKARAVDKAKHSVTPSLSYCKNVIYRLVKKKNGYI